ncbi:MAG: FtsH protease activity modulator HflK, partial [Lachnospiraceae bacterium]|nr:FtsH protease activity modulator HflK [Lachnospiraceae bacterium]
MKKFNADKIINDKTANPKVFGIGLLVLLVLIVVLRCFYTVDEQNNAVVTQFGRVLKVNTAGMY